MIGMMTTTLKNELGVTQLGATAATDPGYNRRYGAVAEVSGAQEGGLANRPVPPSDSSAAAEVVFVWRAEPLSHHVEQRPAITFNDFDRE